MGKRVHVSRANNNQASNANNNQVHAEPSAARKPPAARQSALLHSP